MKEKAEEVKKLFNFVILIFFIILALYVQIAASEEVIKYITLPPCPPSVTGRLDYTEIDKKGNKLEIWCNGAYQMNFSKADGSGGYVGKCPFPWGQNGVAKKVNATLVDGKPAEPVEEILMTFWGSFDAPAPGPGVEGNNRSDRIWLYDVKNNTYIRQNTRHNGTWVRNVTTGNLTYNVTDVKPDGPSAEPSTPPRTPDLLTVAGDPPPSEYVEHLAIAPEFEFITPVPVTTIDAYGRTLTNVYKLPLGSDNVVIEKVEAIENQTFTFDINMPGEAANLVNYSLVSGPLGMDIDNTTGLISWTPDTFQVGQHPVAIKIEYPDLTPHVDEFILKVIPTGTIETPTPTPTITPTVTPTPTVTETPTSPVLQYIVISPSPTVTLTVGQTQQFNSTALDQNNNPMAGVNIFWTVSNISVGTITTINAITDAAGNSSSTFDALSPGITMVNATNGSVSGTIDIIVIAAGPRGDLNSNNVSADAGDLVLMKRASIGEIIL